MENHIKIHGISPRIQYVADGSSTIFEFPFAIFKNENLEVYIGEALQNANTYTVSGAGNSNGGSIAFLSAPAAGSIITLFRNLSIERTTDFQEGGALRANALNYELDYQIACQQQIAENMNRAMMFPPYATNTNVNLTLPTPSAGKAIVWNSDGTNLENSTVEVNAMESTLLGYKTSAENAAATAVEKAGIASDKADIATEKAQIATDKAAEAATVLASKANKDMDNLSGTGKATIIGLFLPDYEHPSVSGGSLSNGDNSITITEASFVVARARQTTDIAYIAIKTSDGSNIGTQYLGNDGKEKRFTVNAFVPAGSYTITHTGANGDYSVYPLKGVSNA